MLTDGSRRRVATFGLSLLVSIPLLVGLACGKDDPVEKNAAENAIDGSAAALASGPADSGAVDGDRDAMDSGQVSLTARCTDGGVPIVLADGGSPPRGAKPVEGAACSPLGTHLTDGCKCGMRCDCTETGWTCHASLC